MLFAVANKQKITGPKFCIMFGLDEENFINKSNQFQNVLIPQDINKLDEEHYDAFVAFGRIMEKLMKTKRLCSDEGPGRPNLNKLLQLER